MIQLWHFKLYCKDKNKIFQVRWLIKQERSEAVKVTISERLTHTNIIIEYVEGKGGGLEYFLNK